MSLVIPQAQPYGVSAGLRIFQDSIRLPDS